MKVLLKEITNPAREKDSNAVWLEHKVMNKKIDFFF